MVTNIPDPIDPAAAAESGGSAHQLPTPGSPEPSPAQEPRRCRACAEPIHELAEKCKECGELQLESAAAWERFKAGVRFYGTIAGIVLTLMSMWHLASAMNGPKPSDCRVTCNMEVGFWREGGQVVGGARGTLFVFNPTSSEVVLTSLDFFGSEDGVVDGMKWTGYLSIPAQSAVRAGLVWAKGARIGPPESISKRLEGLDVGVDYAKVQEGLGREEHLGVRCEGGLATVMSVDGLHLLELSRFVEWPD